MELPVNAKPKLKVNQGLLVSCIKMLFLFTAFVLCNLGLIKLIIEGQTIYRKNLTAKLQNPNQNSRLSWVSLIAPAQADPGALL